MGTVYEAVDERLDSTVALKETLFADERLRKQFEREARLLARMHHQALPRVSDHFSEGEGQFLIMQFIAGDDLAAKFAQRRGPFPAAEVLTWADQLLDALDYLHTQEPQIIHRDIKPQNLKVTERGQIILLDFGLAKGHASEVSRVTTSASIFGYTPNYAPLEQIQGLGTDARSDLYALGATLYHLVTGVKPPDALTRAGALVNGQPDPLKPANEVNSAVTPALSAVLDRAMAQNRDQRYPNAAEMRRALKQGEAETIASSRSEANTVLFPSASPTGSPTQQGAGQTAGFTSSITAHAAAPTGETTLVAKPAKRRTWAIAAAGVVLLIAGAGGFYAYQKRQAAATAAAVPAAGESSPAVQSQPESQPENQASGGEGSAVNSVSVGTNKVEADKEQGTTAEKQAKTKDKAAKQKETAAKQKEANANQDGASEEQFQPAHPPDAPRTDYPNQPARRGQGATVRNLPDGSQLIVTADGTRILVRPDGSRQVIKPGRRVNQRRNPRRP